MNKEEIKIRDRYSCRWCGKRFVDLDVVEYKPRNYITLCGYHSTWGDSCMSYIKHDEFVHRCDELTKINKVVLLGDSHGDFERIDDILTHEEPFDFFLSVGDVGSLEDAGSVRNIEIIDKWGSKGYFVRGNHDTATFFTELGTSQNINGIHVAALTGILKSRNFLWDTSSNISFKDILHMSHLKDIDIFVTHQPPTGVFINRGEEALEELLKYIVPKIYIFGHLHEYRLRFYLNTFCISLPMVNKGHAIAHFQGNDLRDLEIVLKKGRKFIRV